MPMNSDALDQLLNATDIDAISLHSGDPGAAGDQNVVSADVEAITWDAAELDSGTKRKRHASAQVSFSGCTASANVVNIGLWKAGAPDAYRGYLVRTSGDPATNVSGNYTVTTDIKLTADIDT